MLSCMHTALTQTSSYLEYSFLKIKLNISTFTLKKKVCKYGCEGDVVTGMYSGGQQ